MGVRQAIGVVGKSGSLPVPVTSTTDTRMGLAALVRSALGIRPRNGKFRGPTGGNLNVSGQGAWSYLVEPGSLVLAPSATSGAYIVANDAAVSVPTGAKPSTGSRIDIVYMGQADAFDRAAAATLPLLGCAQGVASTGTPTAPAIPDGTVELARNVMTSAATTTASAGNTITQTLGYTAAAGGVTYYTTTADMTADTGRSHGEVGFNDSDDHLYVDVNGTDKRVALTEDVIAGSAVYSTIGVYNSSGAIQYVTPVPGAAPNDFSGSSFSSVYSAAANSGTDYPGVQLDAGTYIVTAQVAFGAAQNGRQIGLLYLRRALSSATSEEISRTQTGPGDDSGIGSTMFVLTEPGRLYWGIIKSTATNPTSVRLTTRITKIL